MPSAVKTVIGLHQPSLAAFPGPRKEFSSLWSGHTERKGLKAAYSAITPFMGARFQASSPTHSALYTLACDKGLCERPPLNCLNPLHTTLVTVTQLSQITRRKLCNLSPEEPNSITPKNFIAPCRCNIPCLSP